MLDELDQKNLHEIKNHMESLERNGIIKGYQTKLSHEFLFLGENIDEILLDLLYNI